MGFRYPHWFLTMWPALFPVRDGFPAATFSWNPEIAETPPASISFTRATTAQVLTTTDGTTNWYQEAKSGEIRYEGLRRVENVIANSAYEDLDTWTKFSNGAGSNPSVASSVESPPLGTSGASVQAVTFTTGGATSGDNSGIFISPGGASGRVKSFSVYMRVASGTVDMNIGGGSGGALKKTVTVTTSWQRFATIGSGASTHNSTISAEGDDAGAAAVTVLVAVDGDAGPQQEVLQGTSDAPNDIVDPGVAAASNNSRVAGVRYFNTTNGNSVDGNGVVTEAAGATITGGGYLKEPSTTNQMVQSSVGDAAWTKTGLTPTDNGVNDAGLEETELNAGTGTSSHVASDDAASGSAGCGYFRVKAGTADYVTVMRGSDPATDYAAFDIVNGVSSEDGSGIDDSFIIDEGNGWYKLGVITSDTDATLEIAISNSAMPGVHAPSFTGVSETVLVDHAQYDSNDFPTSPIVTSGSTVTRNTDVLAGTAWIAAAPYSVFIDQTAPQVFGSDNRILRLDTGANGLKTDGSGNITLTAASGLSLAPSGAISTGDRDKIAFRYAANDGAMAVEGKTTVTDSSVTVNGNSEGNLNIDGAGVIKVHKLEAYDSGLTDTQLETLVA